MPTVDSEGYTGVMEAVYKGRNDAHMGAFAQDGNLAVRFYMGAFPNAKKTAEEGRPIFDEVEMIRIDVPGQTDHIDRLVWDGDKARFRARYDAWKAALASGGKEAVTGTPLSVWPILKVNQVAELKARNIHTVEQLATVADVDMGKSMGMVSLRQAARDFVEAAKGNAPLTQMRAELETRDNEVATLKAQMAEMLKRLDEDKPRSHHKRASAEAT